MFGLCFLFFSVFGEHGLLHRSMRPKMRDPFRMSFYPQSRQLGVGVEVELEVDLEEQVVVDREIYKKTKM